MIGLRHSFNLKCLASQIVFSKKGFLLSSIRNLSAKQEEKTQELPLLDDLVDPEEETLKEAEIERKRNKSKLFLNDYNRQHDRIPNEHVDLENESLRYRRRLYGKYGESSKVNPSILWPSTKELNAIKEYEAVLQPHTVQALLAISQKKKKRQERSLLKREAQILERVSKVKEEILEFHKRVALKKKEALELVEKKTRLVEEVRKYFGYKISTSDPKFIELLAKKQKQEKKHLREAKKEMKEKKLKEKKETNSEQQESELEGK